MSGLTEGERELSLEWLVEEAVSLAKAAGLSCEELIARIEAEWRRQRGREK